MRYLEQLARYILQVRNDDLRNVIVVLPNVRARLFLNRYLKDLAGRALFMPRTYSSSELAEKISGLTTADDYLLLTMLYHVYPKDKEENLPFDTFLNWGNSLLQDLKDIDHQMADADALFKNLTDIKRIEFWNVQENRLSDFQQKYLKFCTKLPEIYKAFNQMMLDNATGHSGFVERTANKKLNVSVFPAESHMVFAGFNALNKAESEIIRYFTEHYKTDVFYDYDKYYLDNKLHEAGHFARINQTKSAGEFRWVSDDFRELKKNVSVYKCTNSYEQVFVVSTMLKKLDTTEKVQNTVIVLADEGLLIPLLQSLPNNITSFNVTMGYPLYNSPFYALFENFIQLYSKMVAQNGKNLFYHKDVFKLFHSAILRQMSTPEKSDLLDDFTDNMGKFQSIHIPINEVGDLFNHLLGLKDFQFPIESGSLTLNNFFRKLILSLDEVLKQKDALLFKLNREFLLHHLEVCTQISSLFKNLGDIPDIQTLHKLWKHYTRLSKVQFTGEPLEGLQIMGLLESRNLDFDHVIVLNANEGVLPVSKKAGSLIPNDLKRHFNLHLHKEKDAIFAYHFYRLIQRARNVDILFTAQVDSLGGGEKSRYINQLKRELKTTGTEHVFREITAVNPVQIKSSVPKSIPKTDYIRELMLEKFRSGLSPTSLSGFVNCPLNFYYTTLVGIKEREELIENIESDIIGRALHKTMELLYKPMVGKILTPSDIKGMRKISGDRLKSAFLEFIPEIYLLKGKNLLLFEMSKKMLARFFDKEEDYVSHHEIEIIEVELKIDKTISLDLGETVVPVRFKGVIDRIEKRNGIFHLIDYKSGNVVTRDLKVNDFSDLLNGKDKALQLLIYSWLFAGSEMYDGNFLNAGIYPFRSYSSPYVPLTLDNREELTKNELENFGNDLKLILLQMLDTEFPFIHNEKSIYCDYC